MEQTRGYFRLEGKIWGLNNKTPFETTVKRNLSFGIQSSKTNTNYVQVGDWKNSKLNVRLKFEGMEKAEEFNEQEALDHIMNTFKDGDSVYLNLRAEVDTYHKKLNYIVSQMYIKDEAIDFDSKGFEEVNELNQCVVVTEKPQDDTLKVGVANYKGEMIELDLALEDDIVKNYVTENTKVGDLMHVTIKVDNRPVYEGGDTVENKPVKIRTTLKGREIAEGGSKGGYRKIKERNLVLVLADIDTSKTESKKYDKSEIREALEIKQYASKAKVDSSDEEDMDLPF